MTNITFEQVIYRAEESGGDALLDLSIMTPIYEFLHPHSTRVQSQQYE